MHKSCPAQIKAAGTDDGLLDGQFRAIVSVFGNVDSYGDVVVRGAFADTLAEWQKSGDPIPVYWSHRMDDPDYNIGYLIEAAETDKGLEVLAQLDLGTDASSKAAQVYRLLKGRRVSQFSFAYDIEEQGEVTKDGQTFNELRKLKLHEVGPTPIGANDQTELIGVKALTLDDHAKTLHTALKALEDSGQRVRDALAAVDAAKSAAPYTFSPTAPELTSTTTTQHAASDDAPVNDEEPHGAKSEEPNRRSSVKRIGFDISLIELEGACT